MLKGCILFTSALFPIEAFFTTRELIYAADFAFLQLYYVDASIAWSVIDRYTFLLIAKKVLL